MQGKKLDISLLFRQPFTYLLACFVAAWSCHIVKTNSAQKRTLTKNYEYLQTLGKQYCYCKAGLAFGDIEIEKNNFYCKKALTFLKDVDLEKVLVSNKITFGESYYI